MTGSTTFVYHCFCGRTAKLMVALVGDPDDQAAAVGAALHKAGWFVSTLRFGKDGAFAVEATCSVACHNNRARDLVETWGEDRPRWWRRQSFEGDPPVCTCTLVEDSHGALRKARLSSCPWHDWFDSWRLKQNELQEQLFAEWKTVPVGTLVRERDSSSKGRGTGRVAGPAMLVQHPFGGGKSAMIPVEDWGPHPRLEDLEQLNVP